MASTLSITARPLCWASSAARSAPRSISRVLSALWPMDAPISSRLDRLTCTAAATSPVPEERRAAVEETCPAADARPDTIPRSSVTTPASRDTISRNVLPNRSAADLGSTRTVKSPSAMRWAVPAISWR